MTARHKFSFFIACALALVVTSCANIVKPGGGPRDKMGPRLDTANPASPANQSVNFIGKEIVLHFDEYLRPGSYAEEIFISPVQKVPPQVLVKGKNLVIRLQDTLRAKTTYIITIGKDIKDATEGNKMDAPLVYAFSTGSKLDSMTFRGSVRDPFSNTGEKEMTLLLFSEEEVTDDSIFGKRPVFASQTDSVGNFVFEYLPQGRFKLYGIRDIDKSYSYNQLKEKIALLPDPLVVLDSTIESPDSLRLQSFLPDNDPPRLKNLKWVSAHTLFAEFREPINYRLLDSSLTIEVGDSAKGSEMKPVRSGAFRKNESQIYFIEPGLPAGQWMKIHFTGLVDTMGNIGDTTLLVRPWEGAKKKLSWLRDPVIDFVNNKIYIKSEFPLGIAPQDSVITLADTTGKAEEIKITSTPFQLVIEPVKPLEPAKQFLLEIHAGLPLTDTLFTDSTVKFGIMYPDPDNFGTFSGEIVPDSTDPDARWIMMLTRRKKTLEVVKRTRGEMKFSYNYLEPGKYSILLIKDDDGNGVYTPGSLHPYRLPEKVVIDSRPLEIRAKWEVDNYKVYTTPPAKSGKKIK